MICDHTRSIWCSAGGVREVYIARTHGGLEIINFKIIVFSSEGVGALFLCVFEVYVENLRGNVSLFWQCSNFFNGTCTGGVSPVFAQGFHCGFRTFVGAD